jgi:ribosomal RNA-processing protein 1
VGLTGHLSDIYLEELDKAIATTSEQGPQPVPLGVLLNPFFSFMAQTSNSTSYKRVQTSLLEPLLYALTETAQPEEEPSPKRARRDPDLYSNLVVNACIDDPQAGGLEATVLKRKLLRTVFEVASRPETKDASRRKMYALWKEGAEEAEEDEVG